MKKNADKLARLNAYLDYRRFSDIFRHLCGREKDRQHGTLSPVDAPRTAANAMDLGYPNARDRGAIDKQVSGTRVRPVTKALARAGSAFGEHTRHSLIARP
jgi:hypothetical protein